MSIFFKKHNIIAVIILSCVHISSPLSKDYDISDLTPMHDERVITSETSASVGDTLPIKLQYNAGTPFSWQCASANDSIADVKDLGVARNTPANDGMVGFRQSRTFIISAIRSGDTTIKCDLMSFDGHSVSAVSLLINIQ
ncbi:protease inhibitor I42 family protein [Methylobacterium sp. NPDC080182]|uniref:protease inhibitor I42 family protein n=1 Tax=Methylobacterium sp. NPDC080182 TaxID=3390590 RepID=UPI003D055769